MKFGLLNVRKKLSIILAVLTAGAILTSCNEVGNISENPPETREVVIVVPAEGKSIISSLISDYEKANSDISVKLINIGGATEEMRTFFVSTLMDEKFNADMMIIDDIWLSEFAGAGLVSEVDGINIDDFIPAAQKGMMYNGKIYGVSLYADAMTEFRKNKTNSHKSVYFEDDINDMSAYVRNEFMKGSTINEAMNNYCQTEKIDNISHFVEQEVGIMQGWLSQYDTIQKYYPVDARYMEIEIDEDSLIKSKLAIINAESDMKDVLMDIVKYLLKEESQIEIMKNITSVSVMSKHYEDPIMIDRFPHLSGISGENFNTFPFFEEYNICESQLKKSIENMGNEDEIEENLKFLAQ